MSTIQEQKEAAIDEIIQNMRLLSLKDLRERLITASEIEHENFIPILYHVTKPKVAKR